MDESEAIVERFLKKRGFQSVIFEPDGNVPPDFLADSQVAVEVRRLNQGHDCGNGRKGLEEISIPLWDKIKKLADSFGPAKDKSWLIIYRFERPVKQWKVLEPILRKALSDFMFQQKRTSYMLYQDECFELEVIPAPKPLESFFCMGSNADYQAGGLIMDEMLRNIEYCSNQKLQKISGYRSKYPIWWLVLTDHIAHGLSGHEREYFSENVMGNHGWDKIVVVSPNDPTNWFEF